LKNDVVYYVQTFNAGVAVVNSGIVGMGPGVKHKSYLVNQQIVESGDVSDDLVDLGLGRKVRRRQDLVPGVDFMNTFRP
jgi:hypothetical protein